jgi:8-oxo-dGTP diphosphatase
LISDFGFLISDLIYYSNILIFKIKNMLYTYEYPRPALTVDALIIAREKGDWYLLLIRRGKEPFRGLWALPGGFVNLDETLEQACCRELEEETGLRLSNMKQFRVFDALDRDPRHRTISVVFYAMLHVVCEVKGDDDASDARWFLLSDLPELAFDHGEIVREFQLHVLIHVATK